MEPEFRDVTKEAIWSSSSAQNGFGIEHLFDGQKETFWQTDALLPHQLFAVFSKQTFISTIQIYVNQLDDNYVPLICEISIGSGPSCMVSLGTFTFSVGTGWNTFSIQKETVAIVISIQKNVKEGRNSRIRLLKCFGRMETRCIDKSIAFVRPELTKYLTIR